MKNTIQLLFVSLLALSQSAAFAAAGPLSGKYVLETTDCVGFLNVGQGEMSPRGFVVGARIGVDATGQALTLTPEGDASVVDPVVYEIGTVDMSGPVSDGPASLSNRYLDGGVALRHGFDNLRPGDNFGSLLIAKTATGLTITWSDGPTNCLLKSAR